MTIALWLIGTIIVVFGPIVLIHELGHFIVAKLAGVRVEEFGFGFPPRLIRLWYGKGLLKVDGRRLVLPRSRSRPDGLMTERWIEGVAKEEDGALVLQEAEIIYPNEEDEPTPQWRQVRKTIHLRGKITELEQGTEYTLNILPMGAFVRMTGEEDPSDPRSLAAQPKGWRLGILSAGALINILFAVALMTTIYATGIPQAWHVRITEVEPDSPAEMAGLQEGDIIRRVAGEQIEDGTVELTEIVQQHPDEAITLELRRDGEIRTLQATPRATEEGKGYLGIWMNGWPDKDSVEGLPIAEAVGATFADFGQAFRRIAGLPLRLIRGNVSAEDRPASVVGAGQVLTLSLQQSIEWGIAAPVLQTAAAMSLVLGVSNLLPLPAIDGGRIVFVLIEIIRGRRVPPEREALVHLIGIAILMVLMVFILVQDIINPLIPWSLLQ